VHFQESLGVVVEEAWRSRPAAKAEKDGDVISDRREKKLPRSLSSLQTAVYLAAVYN
jgi:hypothetical protein